MSRTVTLVMAYYRNPGMLARQYGHWRGLPGDLKAVFSVRVTDDASPKGFRATRPAEDLGVDVEVRRIRKKKPWNWMAARNIGAAHAPGDWLLFTDMDHLVPEATLRRVIEGPLDETAVYRFRRVDAPDLTPYKEHPNSWLMSRALWERFGGFDERFAGCYGSDYDVRNRLTAAASRVEILEAPLVRYPREVEPDASTTDFGRKHSAHAAALQKAKARIAREGGPPLTLSFAWTEVA